MSRDGVERDGTSTDGTSTDGTNTDGLGLDEAAPGSDRRRAQQFIDRWEREHDADVPEVETVVDPKSATRPGTDHPDHPDAGAAEPPD